MSIPADQSEQALAYDLMRAALTTIATRRKLPIVITAAQRRKAFGQLLRIQYDPYDGSIRIWLEEPAEEMRTGVTYLAEPRL